jgi:TonB family protein
MMKRDSVIPLLGAATVLLWLPVGDAAAQSSPVTVTTRPMVSEADYPERASARGIGGRVVVDVAVSAEGVATGCTPVEVENPGSGLEEATCRIWTRRARFSAARNGAGVAIAGVYRTRMDWVLTEPPPAPPPPPVGPASSGQTRVQTVRCETGSGFYIWRVDWDNDRITEAMSGLVLDILDIESTSSSSGYIEAATDPDDVNNFIELDLYFSESDEGDSTVTTTFTQQQVYHARGLGSAARSNRYNGGCRPYRG